MKVTISRGALLDALSVGSKGLSSRSTLPILSGLLLTAMDGRLMIQSTDLETSIRTSCEGAVDQEGSAVIPGRLLTDIVRSLPEGAVTLEVGVGSDASISSGHAAFSMKTLPTDDFPRFPEVAPESSVDLPADVFASVVRQISRAVSRDETRPILTGILVAVEGPGLTMAATDSYRLAVREVVLEKTPQNDIKVVVPGRVLEDVAKMAAGVDAVSMGFSDNQVVFSFAETTLISRRIEGNFPNYQQLLPKDHDTNVTIDKAELIDAVKRVSLFAKNNVPLRFKVTESTLTLSAMTPDVGEAKEDLLVETGGQMDVEIAFNPAFLADGLGTMDGETVSFELVSPLKPAVLRESDSRDHIYLLMPVRLG